MPHPVPVQSLEASSGHGRPVGCCAQRGVIVSLHQGPWVGGGPGSQKAVSVSLQDFTEDVNSAFEFLLKLTPLLDKADQRCKYEVPCSPHCTGRSSGSSPALRARSAPGTGSSFLLSAGAGGSSPVAAECPSPSASPQALKMFFTLKEGGCWAGPHGSPSIIPAVCLGPPSSFSLTAVTVQISYSKNVASRGFCLKPVRTTSWPSGKYELPGWPMGPLTTRLMSRLGCWVPFPSCRGFECG